MRQSGLCHQSIFSESHKKSEPKESARSRDGIARGSDVGNSGSQTTGRKSRERTGIHGPRAGKVAQSDSMRDVAECWLAHPTGTF
jgi:hypothetical protein